MLNINSRKLFHFKITKSLLIVFLVLVVALIFRFHSINEFDLWFDEMGSDMFSHRYLQGLNEVSGESVSSLMIKKMKNDPYSSLYYCLLYAYSSVFGDGKDLRVFSVLFGMLSLILFYKLSRLFFSTVVSLYAILIMALNPFHLYYSQEVRPYSMACFVTLWTIYIFFKALKRNTKMHWLWFVFLGIVSLQLSYHFGALLLISIIAVLLSVDFRAKSGFSQKDQEKKIFIFLKKRIFDSLKSNEQLMKKWFFSFSMIMLSLLIFMPILMNQLSFVKNSFWLKPPSFLVFLHTFKVFTFGYTMLDFKYILGLIVFFIFVYCRGRFILSNK